MNVLVSWPGVRKIDLSTLSRRRTYVDAERVTKGIRAWPRYCIIAIVAQEQHRPLMTFRAKGQGCLCLDKQQYMYHPDFLVATS